MEKYHDSPDCDRLIARAVGWTEIEEMLESEPEPDSEEEQVTSEAFPDSYGTESEDYPIRHPLVALLIERSTTLMKMVRGMHDQDLDEMAAGFAAVGPKVAGALGGVMRDRDEQSWLNGLAVAKLKRAMGELSRALNAANRLTQRNAGLPVPIGEWITEMLKIREELLSLMNEFRCRHGPPPQR